MLGNMERDTDSLPVLVAQRNLDIHLTSLHILVVAKIQLLFIITQFFNDKVYFLTIFR